MSYGSLWQLPLVSEVGGLLILGRINRVVHMVVEIEVFNG